MKATEENRDVLVELSKRENGVLVVVAGQYRRYKDGVLTRPLLLDTVPILPDAITEFFPEG